MQIALLKDGAIVYEKKIPPAQKNRQESASVLLPCIDAGLKELGWKKTDLDLLTVGIGPGSFTGVRVAVITARSIAQGLKLGLLGLSTLELLALSSNRPCAVVLAAGGGKYYAAAYNEDLCAIDCGVSFSPVCASLEEICSGLDNVADLDKVVIDPSISENGFQGRRQLLEYPASCNLASNAALLAYRRISATADKLNRESLAMAYPWDNVLPLYLRSPSVTLKANGSSDKTPIGG